MKKILLAFAFLLVANFAVAQDAAFKADVKKLLQLSGANNQMEMARKQVASMVPADKKEAFNKDFDEVLKPVIEKQEKFYLTEFTHEEVKQIIKFYESPIGKKMAEKAVKLAESSIADSQELGMQMQEIIMKYMQ